MEKNHHHAGKNHFEIGKKKKKKKKIESTKMSSEDDAPLSRLSATLSAVAVECRGGALSEEHATRVSAAVSCCPKRCFSAEGFVVLASSSAAIL
jgi:hypothetical protein